MSIHNQSTVISDTKRLPLTRGMRHIVASQHLQSIEHCPQSTPQGTSLSKLSSFELFGNLPPELRAQVWKFALLVPHMVEHELLDFTDVPLQPSLLPLGIRYKTLHPLLSTCIESRREALKNYQLSGYPRYITLSINLNFDSLFLRDVKFVSNQDHLRPTLDHLGSCNQKLPLLSIFESVECLVISRASILGAGCEAENIIRCFFPSLCLLIVTIEFCAENRLSSNHSQLLLHPQDDFHNSLFNSAPAICHWDAIYASRIETNMQRRFARQRRIHRDYIAPIVKVVSACGRHGGT